MTREEAISEWTFRSNHIKEWLDEYGEEPNIRHYVELIDMAIEALSANAVQGEWKFVNNEIFAGEYFCSICGKRAEVDLYGEWILSNFCPSCGAKMKGGTDLHGNHYRNHTRTEKGRTNANNGT